MAGGSDAKAASDGIDPALAERIRLVLFGSPVARALGVGLARLSVDRATAVLPFRPRM